MKALQRLEDEKSAGAERSLDEQVVAHRSLPEPDRRGLKIGIVAIGGLAVAAAVFLLWPTAEDPDVAVAMESTPPAAVPVAAAPAPAQRLAAEKPRRRTPARTAPAARGQKNLSEAEAAAIVEVVKRLDAQSADSGAPATSPNRVAASAEVKRPARRPSARKPDPQAANTAAKPRPAGEQLSKAAPAAANAEPAARANSVKSIPAKPAPPTPIEIAAIAPEPVAVPASIPAPIRQPEQKIIQRAKLPSLSIEKTIWHPDTDRRIAIVKLIDSEEVLRLKEGDAIGPLVIQSIQPGSVLFNHDGIEIRYNVGG